MEDIEHMENRRTWNTSYSWVAFEIFAGEHEAHGELENVKY